MTDISGLDKVELLHELWKNQTVAPFFAGRGSSPSFDRNDAIKALKNYIDYFCGRAIKANLSGDTADFGSYNRDTKTPAEDVIDNFRSGKRIRCAPTAPKCIFKPYGKPMLGDDGTIMCAHCGFFKRDHF